MIKADQAERDREKGDDDVERAKQEFEKNTRVKQVGRKGLPTFFGL